MTTYLATSGLTLFAHGFRFTYHAVTRMAQRNLTEADVFFVLRYGQRWHRDGVVFYFLGKCDLPASASCHAQRLEGATVIVEPQAQVIITVYRNRKALRRIKRKHKQTREQAQWPQAAASPTSPRR
jgi:hypothetical protein